MYRRAASDSPCCITCSAATLLELFGITGIAVLLMQYSLSNLLLVIEGLKAKQLSDKVPIWPNRRRRIAQALLPYCRKTRLH
jgi:hypothetical protein